MAFFTANRESSAFVIIMGLLPGSSMLIGLRLFSDSNNNFPAAPFFVQGIIATAFGIIFFANTWAKLPIQTEHEFIGFRYQDPYSTLLSVFRSFFLGLLIIPLLIAISIQSFIEIIGCFGFSQQQIIFSITGVLLLGVCFNDLKKRIRIDMVIGVLTVVFILIYFMHNMFNPHQNNLIEKEIKNAFISTTFKQYIPYIFFLWWFATIVDMPDMRSQKLLTLKNNNDGRIVMLIASGLSFLLQGLFWAYPIYLSKYNSWCWIEMIFFVMILMNVIQSILSLNHWAGSLVTSGIANFYPSFKDKKSFSLPLLMLHILLCLVWLLFKQSTSSLIFELVSFTAGVGPLYILRWVWPKVNALANFIAMLCAPIYFILWKWLSAQEIISVRLNKFIHEPFLQSIAVVGVLNVLTWLMVVFFYKNKEEGKSMLVIKNYALDEAFKKPMNWVYFLLVCGLFFVLMFGPLVMKVWS